MDAPDVVFFGVLSGSGAGHFYYHPGGFRMQQRDLPMPPELLTPGPDGRWCFSVPQTREELRNPVFGRDETQGRAFIHYQHGWTIISWWDRSEDRRGACNAVFFLRGYRPWADAIQRAREAFPAEIGRMCANYHLGLAGGDLPGDSIAEAATREVERLRGLHPDVLREVMRQVGMSDEARWPSGL